MTVQQRNDEMVALLKPDFQYRYEPQFALAHAMSLPLGMAQLRGFWPMSSVDENGDVYDLGGQSRTLTNNNAATFGVDGLAPYAEFDGVNQYLSRTDEAGLSITGALTAGGWFWANTTISTPAVLAKDIIGGGTGGYVMQVGGTPVFVAVYVVTPVTHSGTVSFNRVNTNEWFFAAMRYTPSTEIACWLNETKSINTTSIIAAIPDGTSPFLIGAEPDGAGGVIAHFDGRIAFPFICAAALSDAAIFAIYEQTRPLFGA